MSRGQNELISKFKMVARDVISIRRQVMEYTYIPTGIKRESVRFDVNCVRKGKLVGTIGGGPVVIHSSGQLLITSLYKNLCITLVSAIAV